MAHAELRQRHILHFEQQLVLECNPLRRSEIQRLLDMERARPDGPYPAEPAETRDDRTVQ